MEGCAKQAIIALCLLACSVGCANIKVVKVDPQDRQAGTDDKVKGFRYYLTRPYLVIAQHVPVSTRYIPVWPAQLPAATTATDATRAAPATPCLFLVAAVPDEFGEYRVYDQAGHPTNLKPNQLTRIDVGAPPSGPSGAASADIGNLWTALEAAVKTQITALLQPMALSVDDNAFLKNVTNFTNDEANKSAVQEIWNTGKYPEAAKQAIDIIAGKVKTWLAMKGIMKPLDQMKLLEDVKPQLPPPPSPTSSGAAAQTVTRGATLATTKTDSGQPSDQATPPATSAQGQDTLPFQVVFLPDFEEQYAIRNINVTAKTKYRYTFRNGTDLETVAGTYNSTEVPVKIVETVGALITALGQIAQTRLNPAGAAKLSLQMTTANDAPFYIKIEESIEPGVYRLQKSWERAASTPLAGLPAEQICGLFSDVGLPLAESVSVIDKDRHNCETKESCPTPATPGQNPSGS